MGDAAADQPHRDRGLLDAPPGPLLEDPRELGLPAGEIDDLTHGCAQLFVAWGVDSSCIHIAMDGIIARDPVKIG